MFRPWSSTQLRNRQAATTLLLWLVVPGVATAADEIRTSDLFETATVRAKPLENATAAVSVMERDAIEALDVPTVGELLRFIPGVDVASTAGRAGTATVQLRGGDPNYTSVLVDGIPLNDITDQVGGAVDLNNLSTAHVERIEIVRGPLSSYYGSTGLAGAVNIITRRGTSEEPRLAFDLSAGDDATRLLSASVAQGNDRRDYFIGVNWDEQEDAIEGGGDEYDQLGVHGNFRTDLGRRSLRITGRYAASDSTDYPEASGGPLLGSGDLRESDHDEIALGMQLESGDPQRRHRLSASFFQHRLDRESPLIFNPSNPAASVPRSVDDTRFSHWQLAWSAPATDAGPGRLSYGADLRLEDGESNSSFPDLPLDQTYDIDRLLGGLFGEYAIESGRWLFEFGARLDVPEGFDEELSPRTGLSVRLPRYTRLRASAGRAFKLPSFFALAVPVFGNPDLKPETSLGADLGIEHRNPATGFGVALTLFANRFADLVDFDDTLFTHVNVPEIESRGVELAIDWQACERVALHANATRTSFDDTPAGDPLTHRPDWIGGARVVWNTTERTRIELDGQWISEVFDFQVPTGTQRTAGYQLYGMATAFDVAPGWQLHARVDNLADKEYQPFVGFPGRERSFRIGVRRRSP